MKTIDVRFKQNEIDLLKHFLGKTMNSFEHAPFIYTNSVPHVVKIISTNESAFLYCFTEPLDYFGEIEDVSILSFKQTAYPIIHDINFISTPINLPINSITIVQENQKLFENNSQIYDIHLTRGLIFTFFDFQISFEKAVWFSEEIIIRKGQNLIEEFTPTQNFSNNKWADNIKAECYRETVSC